MMLYNVNFIIKQLFCDKNGVRRIPPGEFSRPIPPNHIPPGEFLRLSPLVNFPHIIFKKLILFSMNIRETRIFFEKNISSTGQFTCGKITKNSLKSKLCFRKGTDFRHLWAHIETS